MMKAPVYNRLLYSGNLVPFPNSTPIVQYGANSGKTDAATIAAIQQAVGPLIVDMEDVYSPYSLAQLTPTVIEQTRQFFQQIKTTKNVVCWYGLSGAYDWINGTYDARGVDLADFLRKEGVFENVDAIGADCYFSPPVSGQPNQPWATTPTEVNARENLSINRWNVARSAGKPLWLFDDPFAGGILADPVYWNAKERNRRTLCDAGIVSAAVMWGYSASTAPAGLQSLLNISSQIFGA